MIEPGEEGSCLKPIGALANAIENMSWQDYLKFMVYGTVTPELEKAAQEDQQL